MHMWRFCLCVIALLATPALAQTMRYDDDIDAPHRHSEKGRLHEGHGHKQRHRGGIAAAIIEPSRIGPAPAGLWYRCDEPAGYYPYVPVCRTPWRTVPSTPYR